MVNATLDFLDIVSHMCAFSSVSFLSLSLLHSFSGYLKKVNHSSTGLDDNRTVSKLTFITTTLVEGNNILNKFQSCYRQNHITETAVLKNKCWHKMSLPRFIGRLRLSTDYKTGGHHWYCAQMVFIQQFRIHINQCVSSSATLICGVLMAQVLDQLCFDF